MEYFCLLRCSIPWRGSTESMLAAINEIDKEEADEIVAASDGIIHPLVTCSHRRIAESLRNTIPGNPSMRDWWDTIQGIQ